MDAPDQGPQERLDEPLGEAETAEMFQGRSVRTAEQPGGMWRPQTKAEPGEGDEIRRGADSPDGARRDGGEQVAWRSERVGHDGRSLLAHHDSTRVEGVKFEGVDVELAVQFGIRGEHHLKAPVEEEPVHAVGANPAADAVRRLDNDHLDAGATQLHGAGQSGKAGADHHDWAGHRRSREARASASVPCSKV